MNPQAFSEMYSSDVLSGFDFYKPEFLEVLFRRYGEQGMTYFQLLRAMGWEKPVANDSYSHFEENRTHEIFHSLNAETAPGTGLDHTITLEPGDLTVAPLVIQKYYPQIFDEILFTDETVGYISAIGGTAAAPILTVTPLDETDAFPAIGAGDPVIIISNLHSEGSGQPESRVKGTYKSTNNVQIIKQTVGATGSELTNQDWFTQYGDDGATITGYYTVGLLDLDYRMSLSIDGALLFGKRVSYAASPPTDPATGRELKGTEGLFPFVRRLGTTEVVAEAAMDIDDFDTVDRTLDQQGVGKYTCVLSGINRAQNIEKFLKTYLDNASTQYAVKAFNKDILKGNDSLGAVINFSYLLKSERLFMLKRFNNLNNIKTYGVDQGTTYKMPHYSMFMPLNKKKDPVNNEQVDSIGCRYKKLGNYSRRMEVYSVGGAGNSVIKVTEFDKTETYQRAHIGAHYRGGNQFVLISPTI